MPEAAIISPTSDEQYRRIPATQMTEKLQIRNSTAEFLTFASQSEENSIEVRFENDTLWLTQQLIAELFQTSIPNISMHIKSIYEDKELEAGTTLKNFLTVRQEGNRQVNRNLEYYNQYGLQSQCSNDH